MLDCRSPLTRICSRSEEIPADNRNPGAAGEHQRQHHRGTADVFRALAERIDFQTIAVDRRFDARCSAARRSAPASGRRPAGSFPPKRSAAPARRESVTAASMISCRNASSLRPRRAQTVERIVRSRRRRGAIRACAFQRLRSRTIRVGAIALTWRRMIRPPQRDPAMTASIIAGLARHRSPPCPPSTTRASIATTT